MTPKRKAWWLLLEWIGATFFALLPDVDPVNRALARIYYFFYNGFRLPNLRAPRAFNEKLILLKLSGEARDPLRTRLTDKELVKQHVTAMFGPGHVVPTLAVLRTAREVDSFAFPTPCVVKPTHSSQEVMHLEGQPTREARATLKYWLKKSYFTANREPNYKHLERKLIVEPVIGEAFGAIEDVKVLCFHGRPKFIQVDHARFNRHERDYFDIQGRLLPISMRKPSAGLSFPFPEKLTEMLSMAAALSKGFTFIRIDYYVAEGRVLVGELTSFPTNCTVPFRPLEADFRIAELFENPDIAITPASLGAPQDSSPDETSTIDAETARIIAFPGHPSPDPASERAGDPPRRAAGE